MKYVLYLFLLFAYPFITQATENSVPISLDAISQDGHWLLLLGYEDSASDSSLLDNDFFLSPSGSKDPKAELIATLEEFAIKVKVDGESAQCRYPARLIYLKQKIDLTSLGIEEMPCLDAKKYIDRVDDISLVYATGYLGNPASYYGHLLFKFSQTNSGVTELNSPAINFGAKVPENENMLVYIVKGIFGGYPATYTQQSYFNHVQDYGESQYRDLWEYKLKLSDYQKKIFAAHVYEIRQKNYTYYFFNRNCGYRMGRFLGLVTDNTLTSPSKPWVLPQSIVQNIAAENLNDIVYGPSRQSRLYSRYKALTEKNQSLLREYAADYQMLNSEQYSGLPIEDQYQVLDTILDYEQFLSERGVSKTEGYNLALKKRFLLPAKEGIRIQQSYEPPHKGRKPSYVSVSVLENDTLSNGYAIYLRPAYYDSLDYGPGHIKNGTLAMGSLTLKYLDNEFYVDRLAVIDIEHVSSDVTHLPGDRAFGWQLHVGAKQRHLTCVDCLALNVFSGYGYTVNVLNSLLNSSFYLGARYFGASVSEKNLYGYISSVTNARLSNVLRLRFDYTGSQNENDRIDELKLQGRIELTNNMDLRLQFLKEETKEYRIALGFYW